MPSFTKFFTLAACVVASLAVNPATRCDDARLVKSQSIPTSGGAVSLKAFSCAPKGAVKRDSSSIVNLQGEICTNSCNSDAGNLPPVADDCNQIREAIQILGGVGAIDPTFNLGGYGQQNLTFDTCTFFFTNNLPSEIEFDWSDFGNDANQAASACFPPVMPLHSEGLCSAINGEWSVAGEPRPAMKLKEIYRTATFAWSPSGNAPLLATGTVAGALDENFSNDSRLEIWEPNFLDVHEYALGGDASQPGPKASITTTSRFNRLIWGCTDNARPLGVLAAGMESGELGVWNVEQILSGADASIFRNSTHAGPVRGLDFNPIQKNLLASGATNGEIFIWDINNPATPYAPGSRSARLDEITATAWNVRTAHILATSSSTGYTVVWDLRAKRETLTLAYIGGAATAGNAMNIGSMAMGNRRGMSDVCWHPDGLTRMVTASDDDISPIVMCWDLRNSRAPEKILTGHEKGVLSLAWCKQDSDLLLSCGKDNRVLCWNPQSGEVIGEIPPANNWAFQVDWCPRNPDLFATAFFDGTIGIHSLQTTNEDNVATTTLQDDDASLFDNPAFGQASQASLSLKQPPKWLSRPVSAGFGYGGQLVTVGNLSNAQGRHQSGFVRIHTVVTEESIVQRAQRLQTAVKEEKLDSFAQEKTSQATKNSEDYESWKALLSLFQSNSTDELITLFGFSKENIASQVVEAVAKVKASAMASKLEEDDMGTPHEPVVTFAETDNVAPPWEGAENSEVPQNGGAQTSEATPSELSTSATSDGTKAADIESTTTEHSLFADDLIGGTPQAEAGADFFSSLGPIRSAIPPHLQVPHTNYAQDSSVAATIGSGPSSVASEMLKNNNFSIYPAETSDLDRLLTKALVLGDFDSAVSLCIASDRFADAILLAVKGGEELLQKTQKAYFERQTASLPYLRLFQSIVSDDLEDIVQNADLQEWQEIFVVLCTFSKKEEFSILMEQLGQRLEFQGNIIRTSEIDDDAEVKAKEFKKHATLCYLAAQKLEKVVNIWIEEMCQEEDVLQQHVDRLPTDASRYTVHAQALQTFIEKVTVFRAAAHYVDVDLNQTSSDAAEKSYKLSSLYERYFEYADLLVSQGLVEEAVKYLAYTPADYKGLPGSGVEFDVARERMLQAAGKSAAPTPKAAAVPAPSVPAAASTSYIQNQNYSSPYGASSYAPQQQQQQQPQAPSVQAHPSTSNYAPYNPPASMQPQAANSNTYVPQNQPAPALAPSSQPYGGYGYGGGNQGYTQQASISQTIPPPPPPVVSGPGSTLPPPPQRTVKPAHGWNDAPPMAPDKRNIHNHSANKPVPLTTPFPNAAPPAGPVTPISPYLQNAQSHPLPPPPRAGASTPQRGLQPSGPPPPRGPSAPPTQQMPPPPGHGHPPLSSQFMPPGRPGSGGPGQYGLPPPNRILSPPQGGPPPRPMSGAPQFASPPPPPPVAAAAGVAMGGMGGMGRGTPPPPSSQMHNTPYAPPARATPPLQMQGGRPGFAPGPPGPGMGAPPLSGSYAPPAPAPSGPYAPPANALPRSGPSGMQGPPPSGPATTSAPPPAAPPKAAPPKSKYPPGDRSHIPDSSKHIFEFLSAEMNRMKQQTPPQQKRLVDDTERRINSLFDALNCETLSKPVVERLQTLINAMISRNRDASMALHVELLTQGSVTDDIGVWMAGVKQLIIRL
ncbi:hypothetical protein Clacol_004908 [Clathrus columnatus]|uniref:Protein transport protein SEC31 n=1 Tax=Clathrus columnatus TaxID=1419009 RepID=A0AAV5A7S9_9AGAM|nr:hypothetical protein Clacol_004908 [Clathrus columnatus]